MLPVIPLEGLIIFRTYTVTWSPRGYRDSHQKITENSKAVVVEGSLGKSFITSELVPHRPLPGLSRIPITDCDLYVTR